MPKTNREKRKERKRRIREKSVRRYINLGKGGRPTSRQWKGRPLTY